LHLKKQIFSRFNWEKLIDSIDGTLNHCCRGLNGKYEDFLTVFQAIHTPEEFDTIMIRNHFDQKALICQVVYSDLPRAGTLLHTGHNLCTDEQPVDAFEQSLQAAKHTFAELGVAEDRLRVSICAAIN